METAVLYRDNDSALPLIDRLDRAGIPYRCRQVESLFFTNRVVRDITDIIRFALDPTDGAVFLKIYYKLGAGISRALAQEAVDRAEGMELSILEYIFVCSAASPWTKKQCRALQTHMQNLRNEQADRAVYRIVHYMGYGDYLEERGGDSSKADILEALGAQEPTPLRLLERLEELREVVQSGSAHLDCPFVLSTIHSSKGLEYERVFLMDVADGLFPKLVPGKDASQEELEAYEEERRLFYVGMTRAKRELSIFTFRKNGAESTFSREIFPPKETPTSQSTRPKPLPVRPWMAQSQTASLTEGYVPETRLVHKVFGPGTLVSRSGDIALISFDRGAIKKIALSTALRAEQLHMEE